MRAIEVFSSLIDSTERHPSLGLIPLAVLSLILWHRSQSWRAPAIAICALAPLAGWIALADHYHLDAAKNAAHAMWPGVFAWLVWATYRPRDRARRAIVLGYALASAALGATWAASWRAPALYEMAMLATRWVAALLVTLGWAGAQRKKDEGPRETCSGAPSLASASGIVGCFSSTPQASTSPTRSWATSPRRFFCMLRAAGARLRSVGRNMVDFGGACRSSAPLPDDGSTRRTHAHGSASRSLVNGPRAVASILGGGHALGLIGAWMLGEPRRDWYLARGLTWAEYAVCGVVMLVCLIRRRV